MRTNPLLRELVETFLEVGGRDIALGVTLATFVIPLPRGLAGLARKSQ